MWLAHWFSRVPRSGLLELPSSQFIGVPENLLFLLFIFISHDVGSVLSAFFEKFENIVIFSLIYDYLAVALCGAYISLGYRFKAFFRQCSNVLYGSTPVYYYFFFIQWDLRLKRLVKKTTYIIIYDWYQGIRCQIFFF